MNIVARFLVSPNAVLLLLASSEALTGCINKGPTSLTSIDEHDSPSDNDTDAEKADGRDEDASAPREEQSEPSKQIAEESASEGDATEPGDAGIDPEGTSTLGSTEPDESSAPTADTESEPPVAPSVDEMPAPTVGATATAVPPSAPPGVVEPELSACQSTTYGRQSSPANMPGVHNVYLFGDGLTSACATLGSGKACVEGNGHSSVKPGDVEDDDYGYYGAGIGLELSADGGPFDAAALGIVKVRFSITELAARPLRILTMQANDPNIVEGKPNYHDNAFVWGDVGANDVKSNRVVTIALDEFTLPSWTGIEGGAGRAMDPSQVTTLQVEAVNDPTSVTERYNFCVSDLEWLDADDHPVTLGD